MRKTFIFLVLALVALLLGSAGAVYAYDSSRPEQLALGVTIGGIDVGGLTPAAARERVRQGLVAPLQRSVIVDHGNRRWKLGPREARIRMNVDAMVADAARRSDEGGILKRTLRRLTDSEVDLSLEPEVTFSDRSVVRLVDKVRRRVDRRAVDARMTISPAGVQLTDGRRGLRVKAEQLHREIKAALTSPSADRRFVAQTAKISPKVTRGKLAKQNPVVLIADRGANTLRVYKSLELVKTYGIAAGSPAYPTPAGQFTIANKAIDPAWSVPNSDWAGSLKGQVIPGGAPNNPLKARWMGIVGGVGIHGTGDPGSIGSNASHGCLRMNVADVIELYPQVPVGAKVLIT